MHSLAKCIALVLILLGWAAVAQAVPVDLLKTPVPADVACGGAVDEAATLKAVQHWVLLCNNELSAIDKNDERRIMGYLLDMKVDYLSHLRRHSVKEKISELVEPVLQRWVQQALMKKASGLCRFLQACPLQPGGQGLCGCAGLPAHERRGSGR